MRRSRGNRSRESRPPAVQGGARSSRPPGGGRFVERRSSGPILIVAMVLLNRNQPFVQQVFPAVFLIAFFIPFSYFTDSLTYRMFQKRLARRDAPKTR